MSWNEEKVAKLKELWGKHTASEISTMIGDVTRNAIIGKANRMNLSAKIKAGSSVNKTFSMPKNKDPSNAKKLRKSRFRSMLIEKDFEPAKNLTLEELTEETCKYMDNDKHPDQPDATFCGRKSVEKFSYCPLYLITIFQPRSSGKKEETSDKDEETPQYIVKKNKSA